MCFPQLKLGEINRIPRTLFVLGCISEEELLWTVCLLEFRFSGPEALEGLVEESGHLEAGR